MQPEEKKKIQAWVPVSIWIQIDNMGFKSQNEAVNFAFEKIIEIRDNNQVESENNQIDSKNNQLESNLINELQTRLEEKEKQIKEKDRHIETLRKELEKAPDPIEFAQMRTKSEELENHKQTLVRDLEKAEQDKDDLKNTYNNYFLQVQTLINQKAIEAPGEKKRWWKFW